MAKRFPYLVGLLAVALSAATAGAQSTQFSLDLGYQWIDVSGSNNIYRSQVNEGQGLLLRSFSLTSFDTSSGSKLFDRLRIDAAGIGAAPQATFRLTTGLAKTYDLRLAYRHAEMFNALTDFANPLLASGLNPGEHTINRAQDSVDLDIEALPGSVVSPLFGYRWARYAGTGRTTVQVGQDEFRLRSDLDETTQEVRAGVGFHFGTFAGNVVQGWRSFDQTQRDGLLPGAGAGNNATPVLGRDITLESYTRQQDTSGTTPMTNAYLTGRLGESVRVVGSFARADFSSDTIDEGSANGALASFKLSRFFSALQESVRARAESLDWRGEARVETEIVDGLEVTAGYTKKHREFDGLAAIADLYANTVNFSGADPKSVTTLVNAQTAMTRDEKIIEARVSTSNLGLVRLWAAWARSDEDLTVTPDAAEIVVPGGQGGRFEREIKRTSAGATLALSGLRFSVDWKKDDADQAVTRIDFLNLERVRGRLNWTAGSWLQLVGTAERIKGENPAAGIGHEQTTKHWAADAVVTPINPLSVRLGYEVYKVDSQITVRRPEDFGLEPSLYTEDGTSKEAGITYKLGRVGLDASYSQFENTGDLALKLDRTTVGFDVDFTKTLGVSVRFDKRKYQETALPIADFDAKIYGVFLRWRN